MISIFIAFFISFVISLVIIRYKRLHEHITGDHDLDGVQKFHSLSVPRIGGCAVLLGMASGGVVQAIQGTSQSGFILGLLGSSIFAFAAGFAEDLTKNVGIKVRLLATILSAIAGGYILGGWLTRTDTFIDPALSANIFIIILITSVCVAGVSNAFNLIDGYNGLSAGVALLILLGLVYVSGKVGDRAVLITCLLLCGSLIGFLIWNYPKGHIFLGDGGAYFVGFMIAELSLLLVVRNNSVSPWFPVLLAFYPIFETLYTIFRRVILQKSHPGMPDAAHLHQLIYKKIVKWVVGDDDDADCLARNSMTSPYLWAISSAGVIPAVIFWQHTQMLQVCVLFFAIFYVILYKLISRIA